jgi:Tol biopolymer transport system component
VQAAVRSGLDALAFPLVGETISHYRILEGLGGGGMGLVYRAEDVKLGRQVALKFLPEESRKDPVALSRFEREARSASLIEHPNICPIYEFGEYEGQPFLVMQLLQGQTLRELLSATSPAKSPLGLDQLLDLALQITRGLEAAHSHGIIHRDIKPANIFVTKQGQAKILDFGLAKLSHGGVADEEERQLPRDAAGRNGAKENAEAPAPPDPFLSRTGVAMGTAGYMSPEQERGEKLDARTDLFSFGLVLNEMTAALRASKGDQGLHPAIRKSQRQFNPLLPSKLEAVIGKTLERDRDLRYQSALELRADLQAVQELLTPSKGLRSSKHKSAKSVWVTCGTAALVLLSALVLSRHIRKTPNSQLASVEVVPLIAIEGKQGWPLFSPDGKRIAFAQFEGPHPGIYTTLVGGEKPLQLTENLRDCCPAWSPDGRQIVFVRYEPGIGRSFYVVPALGGSERRLYTGPLNGRPSCDKLDWSPEGKALMFTEPTNGGFGSRITLLSLSDFTTKPLTSPQNHVFDCEAVFSPDGRSLAFVRGFAGGGNGDLFLLGVSGGEPRQLTFGNSAGTFAWTPDGGEIVFSSVMGGLQNLWRVSSSGGTPRPVEGIGGPASRPSISSKGEQLVFQQSTQNDNVWRIDLKDEKHALGPPVLAFSSRGYIRRPSFSPDGKKVAFESDRLGYSDIWICESEGSNCAQVTSLHTSGTARWSPDGRHLVFESDYQGLWQVYVVQVPGGEPQLFRTFPETDNGAPNWSVDGKWIYFYSGHQHTTLELWKIPFNGGAPIEVTRNGGVYATESEDGSSLYYAKFGKQGIWRMPLNGGEETHILDQPMSWYDWALTPTGIYFINNGVQPEGPAAFIKHVNGRIEFFDFANREITPIHNLEKPASEFGGLAISPDGKYLLYGQTDADDSYNMLVKNFR